MWMWMIFRAATARVKLYLYMAISDIITPTEEYDKWNTGSILEEDVECQLGVKIPSISK